MCDERERLIGYVFDDCEPDERRQVEQHLERCETCRDEIRGLRATRQDLLAWDVPAHESVWRPFVSPHPAPWWKQVPAWGLAAAASLMFLAGAAGGAAVHAWLGESPVRPAAVATAERAVNEATRAEIAAARDQILQQLRADLERASLADAETATRTQELERRVESTAEFIVRLYGDFAANKSMTDRRLAGLQTSLESWAGAQGGIK